MTGFGEELRLQRERRGVSLSALCAETKVNARYFEALERGDFHELPGGVFRRGIVRSYVHALGLEEEEVLPRFEQSLAEHARRRGEQPVPKEEEWVAFAMNVRKSRRRQRPRTGLRWLGVAVLALALLAAAWAVWRFEWIGIWSK